MTRLGHLRYKKNGRYLFCSRLTDCLARSARFNLDVDPNSLSHSARDYAIFLEDIQTPLRLVLVCRFRKVWCYLHVYACNPPVAILVSLDQRFRFGSDTADLDLRPPQAEQ